jgi:SAM-dependent methyltransferase
MAAVTDVSSPEVSRQRVRLRDVLRAPLTNLYLLQELHLVLKHLPLSPSDTVMEVGCGAGTTALVLSNHVRQVTGIDISEPIIRHLEQNYASERVGFLRLDACDTSIKLPSEYDKAVCIDTLGYVSRPDGLLKFICQNLKDGGLLVLTTPARSPLGRNEFTLGEVVGLLKEAGFEAQARGLRPRRRARWLTRFYDLCQNIGAEPPKQQSDLQDMNDHRFEDVAYPCLVMLQRRPRGRFTLLKLAIYLLFSLCRDCYEDDPSGKRFLAVARKPHRDAEAHP